MSLLASERVAVFSSSLRCCFLLFSTLRCRTKLQLEHFLLKCVTTAIITPFYSASLVETVQSDIASEKPGILDVFRDGLARLISWSDPR